ncbi:MAG: hemolysin family protein [Chloroflexota bacterium]
MGDQFVESSWAFGLASVIGLVLANGFFVATEFAIVAVRRSRLDQLAAEGSSVARLAREIVGHLDAYIAACQLGITMTSLALGWIGEPALAGVIEPPVEALVGTFAPTVAHAVSTGIAFAMITSLHIVIGELAPKGLALQRTEETTLAIARPIHLFYILLRWPITALNNVGNGVLRIFGMEPASGHEMVHKVEELRLLVMSSKDAGEVEASEARIAARAFTFADLTAEELMTPRTEIEAIAVDASPAELQERITSTRHTRLPVYEGSLDRIVGVIFARDVLHALVARLPVLPVRQLMQSPVIVFASWPADRILEQMRTTSHRMAVVQDEYSGTAGIITFEDLVEALVGPIAEETENSGHALVTSAEFARPGTQIVDGLTRLSDWEELAGVKLPDDDHEAVDTLGGLVMTRLGRIPDVGDQIQVEGLTLRVEELDGRRVALVRMEPTVNGQTTES